MDIATHLSWFDSFAAEKKKSSPGDSGPLDLKIFHTHKVLERAGAIVKGENFGQKIGRAILLGAIYHDVGRFDQYLEYGTFKDADSCNHGILSARIVKKEKRLEDEDVEIHKNTLIGITLHNRFTLPRGLSETRGIIVNAIRDADKLDILRIMAAHLSKKGEYNPTIVLSLPDNDRFSPSLIEAVMSGKSGSYQDLNSVNDFRLLLGAWFFDLNFASSREMFAGEGHAARILAGLPDNSHYGRAKEYLMEAIARG